MEEKAKLFNAGFLSITAINFIVYLVYYLLMVIIAVIAQQKLHASVSQAGLAAGIYVIGTLLARLFIGKRLELFGRSRVLKWGALFYLLTTLAYFYMPSILVLCVVRLLNGFFYGTVSTATNVAVTGYIPFERRGEGINYYGLSTSLAAAVGPFIGMILLAHTSFYVILLIAVILTAIVTIFCMLIKVKNVSLHTEEVQAAKSWKVNTFIEKRVTIVAVLAFLMGIAYSSVLSFMSSYASLLHLVTAGSYFFVVYALVITFTRPATGKLFDACGENSVMYPSFILLTLGLFAMFIVHSSWVLLLAGAFVGLGYGTFMSNGQAVAIKLVPEPSRVGIALSTYFVGLDLGIGVGPYFFGMVRSFVSFRSMYLLAAVIPLVCVLLYKVAYRPNTAPAVGY